MDKLTEKLTDCAVNYLNNINFESEEYAADNFKANIEEIMSEFSLSVKEVKNKFLNIDVRSFSYGDQPDNISYFSPDKNADDIIEMIEDSFSGDYGDETNEEIDNFINELKSNPGILKHDFTDDDPAGGTIEILSHNVKDCIDEYAEFPFPENIEERLSDCAIEYLNHFDDSDAKNNFQVEIENIAEDFGLSEDEVKERFLSLSVRCLTYGDQPDNFVYFSQEDKPDDIIYMLDENIFGGDYGDETNNKINDFINMLKDNPQYLEKDFSDADPVGGRIEIRSLNVSECCENWPFPDNNQTMKL